jgi:HEAT repeat protein/ATP/ADP translocase
MQSARAHRAASYHPRVNRLVRALAIRPGEARGLALVAGLFALIEAGRGFGEVGADTVLLSRIGPGALPYLYVILGLASLLVALAFGAAVGRLRMGSFFTVLLGLFAILLAVLGWVALGAGTNGFPAIWLTVYVVGTVEGTLIWALAGAMFDARQAKRLFPICTSAAILGGFVGTLLAGPVARAVGAELLVAVDGALVAVAAIVAALLTLRAGRALTERPRPIPIVAQVKSGYDYVRSSPLMRLVAISYVLFSVLAFAVSFPFLKAMAGAFPDEADLATALGLLSAGVTAASFLTSIGVANRVYARFGIATAALVLPLVYLAGFATWLVAFTVVTAVVVRAAQQVTQRGLSNAAWNAFYTVVPRERRARVLSFMDGVPGQLGTSLSGLLLIAAGALLAPGQVAWIGLIAAAILVWVVLRVRRRYAESIVATLRAGLAEQMLDGGPGLIALGRDPELIGQLRRGLTDDNPRVRTLSAEVLGRLGRGEALDELIALLADDDAGVRAAAVGAIGGVCGRGAERSGESGSGNGRSGGSGGDLARSRAVEAIAPSLDDAVPAVRVAAIRELARLDGSVIAARCDAIETDTDPAVRGELAVALVEAGDEERPHAVLARLLESPAAEDRVAGLGAVARLGGHLPSPRLIESLADPVPAVRAAALGAVAAVDPMPDRVSLLAAGLEDEARPARAAAAAGLGRHFEASRSTILEVLRDGSPVAQEAALAALDGQGPEVRDELLAWSTAQVSRAEALRTHARSLDGTSAARTSGPKATGPTAASAATAVAAEDRASVDFLRDILERREWQIEDRLLTAVAIAGAGDVSGLLRRCLRSNDSDIRAQAIEALDSIGDRGLGRAFVRLLESDPVGPVRSEAEVLRDLTIDPDPWVRALAVRALSTQLEHEWRTIVGRARADPEPLVRSMVEDIDLPGGRPMADTRDTLGEIDRMLFLRRVPLFSELAPEDLQRIGATARERLYPADETIFSEGELGDELVVIVEGRVRVVRGSGTDERTIRTYEAGDHFGELAVLRERPRAATVIADAPGVRGLVIDGEGLRAILRERPEAAMSMLATLAERISSQ